MLRVPPDTLSFPVLLQRNSFGPRLVARAGDVWRAIQDVVVDQSNSVGWTAERYAETNTMFVVRTMTVVHQREVRFGESLTGRTWPSRARRDMLFTRETRLFAGTTPDELIASATQEWAYLSRDLVPLRAGKDLYDAFTLVSGFPSAALPEYQAIAGAPVHQFRISTWHTWMDAQAHLNHPAYLDLCEEGTAQALAAAGVDPQQLVPSADEVHFRAAIGAGKDLVVETQLKGRATNGAVIGHRLLLEGAACATATTVRRLVGGQASEVEAALLRAPST